MAIITTMTSIRKLERLGGVGGLCLLVSMRHITYLSVGARSRRQTERVPPINVLSRSPYDKMSIQECVKTLRRRDAASCLRGQEKVEDALCAGHLIFCPTRSFASTVDQ